MTLLLTAGGAVGVTAWLLASVRASRRGGLAASLYLAGSVSASVMMVGHAWLLSPAVCAPAVAWGAGAAAPLAIAFPALARVVEAVKDERRRAYRRETLAALERRAAVKPPCSATIGG